MMNTWRWSCACWCDSLGCSWPLRAAILGVTARQQVTDRTAFEPLPPAVGSLLIGPMQGQMVWFMFCLPPSINTFRADGRFVVIDGL